MSSHCSRYPSCGCGAAMGSWCHISDEAFNSSDKKDLVMDFSLRMEEKIARHEGGADVEQYKQNVSNEAERKIFREGSSRKPHRKYPTNYTPPKKRRKKR